MGYARVEVAEDRGRPTGDEPEEELDTAALLDQGEQLLAESQRLLRRLDAALERKQRPDADRGRGAPA